MDKMTDPELASKLSDLVDQLARRELRTAAMFYGEPCMMRVHVTDDGDAVIQLLGAPDIYL